MADLYSLLKKVITKLSNKVDKSGSKQLSDENYTSSDKSKLNSVEVNANRTTAENFEGILPVGKGGTGNSITSLDDAFDPDNFRSQINQPLVGDFIAPSRHEHITDGYWDQYSTGIKFGARDTHGYLAFNYVAPVIDVGGGFNGKITWHGQLALKQDIPTRLTNSMLSSGVVIEEDWNNLFTKKQNEIYTIATWSFNYENAPPASPFFGTLFNYYDEGMNYGYQIAIDVHVSHIFVRSWHDNTIFTSWKELTISNSLANQLVLTSLYESKNSSAQSDVLISSPTFDGELSSLDQNIIKIYTDLCLNPNSGKTIEDVPENLREQVRIAVEKILTERKEMEASMRKKVD